MKYLDFHKFIKTINTFNKRKNYPFFNLKCGKNKILQEFINLNKGKILNDYIKYKYEKELKNLINKISLNKLNKNIKTSNKNINDINNDYADLLIYITHKNNENIKKNENIYLNKNIQNINKKNNVLKYMFIELHNKKNSFLKSKYTIDKNLQDKNENNCNVHSIKENEIDNIKENVINNIEENVIDNVKENEKENIKEDDQEKENFSKIKITKENIININEKKVENDNYINETNPNEKKNIEKENYAVEKEDTQNNFNQNNQYNTSKNIYNIKKCLYPHEIVEYLNKYIIGQNEAKKVIANALRQRWRRMQVNDDIKKDIIPKNILMIGPTGVGKTEIARRISMFVDAPFIKVEATKFTEVGFHGKDVDQIIKDLVEIAVKKERSKLEVEIRQHAQETVENIILYSLLGNIKEEEKKIWRKFLKDGSLDDKIISIDIPNYINNIFSNDSVENAVKEALSNHQNIKSVKIIHQNINKNHDKKQMTIREAKQKLLQLEIDSSINQELLFKNAINSVEEEGIVFIDEIDKICSKSNSSYNGPDASAEGVQRDLLPLIEGCVINTKYGNVNTDYILFIASGAFQRVKPNDMLNELQGRLPVQVTLSSLSIKDFIDILTKTHNNLIQQNIALLKTENINLQFTEDGIECIANAAHDMNFYVENIGVRRLHTIIEKIMEDINYDVYNYINKTVIIDKDKIKKSLEGYIKQHDLKKYIL